MDYHQSQYRLAAEGRGRVVLIEGRPAPVIVWLPEPRKPSKKSACSVRIPVKLDFGISFLGKPEADYPLGLLGTPVHFSFWAIYLFGLCCAAR